MQKNNLGILTTIALFLAGCNFASSRYEYNVDCRTINVFEFKVKGSYIKYKITGYLENDATIYIQSFNEDGTTEVYIVDHLEKGIVNCGQSFGDTYGSKGRIIYIPKGEDPLNKKEKLIVQIQTIPDWKPTRPNIKAGARFDAVGA